jgi:putative alpha-1,2-mannosidase
MAYLYNYIDKPEKTNEKVHYILDNFYKNAPDGLIGNEDCGQMSAWYVLSSMGIYQVTPGFCRFKNVGFKIY